jgi:hypothetical protein
VRWKVGAAQRCFLVAHYPLKSKLHPREEADFLSKQPRINQSPSQNTPSWGQDFEMVAWNIVYRSNHQRLFLPRPTSGGSTGTPDCKETLTEAPRGNGRLHSHQSSSVRSISRSGVAPLLCISPSDRAGKGT